MLADTNLTPERVRNEIDALKKSYTERVRTLRALLRALEAEQEQRREEVKRDGD